MTKVSKEIEQIHDASLILAKVFNEEYRRWGKTDQTDRILEVYKEVRRLIPEDKLGKRYGSEEAYAFIQGAGSDDRVS
jgi:hypothetical protein